MRWSGASGVESAELELHCEGPHGIGIARWQPFHGPESQMVGDHHAPHLGRRQFASQWFFRQGGAGAPTAVQKNAVVVIVI
jgi:hypothetical protein